MATIKVHNSVPRIITVTVRSPQSGKLKNPHLRVDLPKGTEIKVLDGGDDGKQTSLAISFATLPSVRIRVIELAAVSSELLSVEHKVPELVLLPAGTFPVRGSRLFGNRRPSAERVAISQPFYMGKYPVTVEEWKAFVKATNYFLTGRGALVQAAQLNDTSKVKHPVVYVNRGIDCQAYVNWLNTLGIRNAEGQELEWFIPSAAEWEYAARSKEGRRYPWGETWMEGALETNGTTYPINKYLNGATPQGIFLVGNVWRWINTSYGPYPINQVVDPTGPSQGKPEVRGGSAWEISRNRFQGVVRGGVVDSRRKDVGFQVAARVKKEEEERKI